MRPLRSLMHKTREKIIKHRNSKALFRKYCIQISKNIASPVFVKVGANDGISGDPCSDIILKYQNWCGILIEPVPYCFEKLKTNFSDAERFELIQLAIGPRSNKSKFYYVDSKAKEEIPDLPYWYDQLGSFYKSHIENRLNGVLKDYIIEAEIEVLPLSELVKRQNIEHIDLLHIDTEGYDFEVIKTLDFSFVLPTLIFVEHVHLSYEDKRSMVSLLKKFDYKIYDCGTDFFAISKEQYSKLNSFF